MFDSDYSSAYTNIKYIDNNNTYEFTTSQSVLCKNKLNVAIGSYEYAGTSAELNAMTILSNNGITGVSKIVGINVTDTKVSSEDI